MLVNWKRIRDGSRINSLWTNKQDNYMSKLTIGIPTYNGSITLNIVLNKINECMSELNDTIELIVSDNASTDDTREICENFSKHNNNIINFKYLRNPENLGYDANVYNVVEKSTSDYCWLLSDNEIPNNSEGLQNLISYLGDKDLDFLFLDYINEININKKKRTDDEIFTNADEYFQKLKFKSGLISNCVVNVERWKNLNLKKYIGCNWIHFAYQINALAPNFNKNCKAVIFYDKIFSSLPRPARWGTKGSFIDTGLQAVKIFNEMYFLGYKKETIKCAKKVIYGGYPKNLFVAKLQGYNFSHEKLNEMKSLYKEFSSFNFYSILIKLPKIILRVFMICQRSCNKLIRIIKQ